MVGATSAERVSRVMSFDRLAPHYRWLEFVLAGNKLQLCRTAFLNHLSDAQEILILGEGNGRFLAELGRRGAARARITCVDSSAGMLSLAQSRIAHVRDRDMEIEFVHADALQWEPSRGRTYDAVVTHFFLDCFRPEQLQQLIAKLSAAATGQACWLLADFQIPNRGWRRLRARVIHRLMYVFFRLMTRLPADSLTSPDPFLQENGFTLRKRRLSNWNLLHSDLWERCSGRSPNRSPADTDSGIESALN